MEKQSWTGNVRYPDQYTSPTYSMDLARMFKEIIERRITGIINTACTSRLSRYEQAIKVAKIFRINPDLILQSSSVDMSWLAKRPRDSSLDTSKALKLLRHTPRDYDSSLRDFSLEVRKTGGYNVTF
jgi:dTDP-4-dehydrorhamnose reductase